tara:strand:+ start:2819 stop:3718 length:900 start_codon:yes stop_codon:yes gene_type:complete
MALKRTRFAPSPNGKLHLGHAFSAIISERLAKKNNGEFIVRIEDIDIGRTSRENEELIIADLNWLNIKFDEKKIRRQSEYFELYEVYLKRLRDLDLVYPCWATRSEIKKTIKSNKIKHSNWPIDPDGQYIYPGIYKNISPAKRSGMMLSGKDFSWRLDIEKAINLAQDILKSKIFFQEVGLEPIGKRLAEPHLYGDIIIARKDIPTSYHLSVTIDDFEQNINLVTRGLDIYPATSIHRLLQVIFDLPEPEWFHHNLIRDKQGIKLSKTSNSTSIEFYRNNGISSKKLIDKINKIEPFPI